MPNKKKNPFAMYMEERKPELMAAGYNLSEGWKVVAEIVSKDWERLSEKEKQNYAEKAEKYNGQHGLGLANNPVSPKINAVTRKPLTPLELLSDELEPSRIANRKIVEELFEDGTWMNQRIVVCSFTLYFDPYYEALFYPAEIGLTTFSIKEGVIDNYARVIDPGQVPMGYGIEIFKECKRLGLPDPGEVPEFLDYETLLFLLKLYLDEHRGNLKGPDIYVFAFDSDYDCVYSCLEWLNVRAKEAFGCLLPFKVLSLTLFGFMASRRGEIPPSLTVPTKATSKNTVTEEEAKDMNFTVSSNRTAGKPLHSSFIYAADFPTAKYGVIFHEQDVDLAVKKVDNYQYYFELCCVYHYKKGDGIQNCALNMSNRYAYGLLEILTMSNEVEIIPGKHFPDIDNSAGEVSNRHYLLRMWGISDYEDGMENPPDLPAEVISGEELSRQSFQNRERNRDSYDSKRRPRVPGRMAKYENGDGEGSGSQPQGHVSKPQYQSRFGNGRKSPFRRSNE